MTVLAYPHPYINVPEGDYTTINDETNPYWPNLIVTPSYNDPKAVVESLEDDIVHEDGVFVPLSEGGVSACGMLNDEYNTGGLSQHQALICTNRPAQREWLDEMMPENNVAWTRILDEGRVIVKWTTPSIIKASASCLSRGVTEFEDGDVYEAMLKTNEGAWTERQRVRRAGGEDTAIIEESVYGQHYDVNGYVDLDGGFHFLTAFGLFWMGEKAAYAGPIKSMQYMVDLKQVAEDVVENLALRGCGFNMEVVINKKDDVVSIIEFHARVGEDHARLYTRHTENWPQLLLDSFG